MPIDPKKDPARRCLPVEAWPEPDQRAWRAALCEGDVLNPGGAAVDWAPHTRQKISKGYGRWLTWLASRGLLDLNQQPAERITPTHLRDYVGDLTVMNAPYTVLARAQELYQAIGAMVPGLDWAWLRQIERRLRYKAVPVRDKRLKVVSSESLLAFGVELMSAADDPGTGTSLKRALRYRDGLIIVLLAARPLRRRDFMRIEIGTNLVRQGDVYWIRFANGASKTGMLIDLPVPDALVPRLERSARRRDPTIWLPTELRLDHGKAAGSGLANGHPGGLATNTGGRDRISFRRASVRRKILLSSPWIRGMSVKGIPPKTNNYAEQEWPEQQRKRLKLS